MRGPASNEDPGAEAPQPFQSPAASKNASEPSPDKIENERQPAEPEKEAPPNGGYGWVCVACTAIVRAQGFL